MAMTASRLSEPDVLTRDQWDAFWRGSAALSSEKRLMLAVLKSALECYQKYVFAGDRQGVEMFREADDWIHCDADGWVFSYRSICETLGISADGLRRHLSQWHRVAAREQAKERQLV
jgi:hypothetical protein